MWRLRAKKVYVLRLGDKQRGKSFYLYITYDVFIVFYVYP